MVGGGDCTDGGGGDWTEGDGEDLPGGGDMIDGGGGDFTSRFVFFSGAGVPSGEGDLLPAMEASGDLLATDGPSGLDRAAGDLARAVTPSVPAGDFNPESANGFGDLPMRGEGVLLRAACSCAVSMFSGVAAPLF